MTQKQYNPNFVNGGVIEQLGTSSATGSDELFVIEADESDGTFLLYDTAVALITNVDPDHLDFYGSDEAFHDAFVRFADAATEAVVISSDDPGALRVSAGMSHRNVITFGLAEDADLRITDLGTNRWTPPPHRRPNCCAPRWSSASSPDNA